MVRYLLLLLLLPLAPLSAADDVVSTDSRSVAWFAWEAGNENRQADVPELLRYLSEGSGRSGSESDLARLFLLDALIRLEAKVAAAEIVPCLSRTQPVEEAAVILAIRGGDDNTLLLSLDALDPSPLLEESWLAIGNALTKRRPPGFAFRLLARFTADLRIFVDDRPVAKVAWRGPSGSIPGDGIIKIPEGFPPVPVYSLTDTKYGGSEVLLADGHVKIWFRRRTCTDKLWFGGTYGGLDEDEMRLEWIASLLGCTVPELGVARRAARSIGYPSEKLFLRRLRAVRRELGATVFALADRLVAAGHLSRVERGALTPLIRIRFTDRRLRKTPPIPVMPKEWLEPVPPEGPPPQEEPHVEEVPRIR